MKLSLLTLAALLALASAVEPDQTIKKADVDFLKKQAKVLSLYVGLGSDVESRHHHEHVPFPFDDPKYYKNPKILEGFMKSYDRGMLDRHGVFTMFCHKNRHDTFNLFDIFYYAKDFDTLHDIAVWARGELNPLQFFYAYSMAVLHREDTRGIYVPPVFEIFPQNFIQASYMNEAIAYNTFHEDEHMIVHEVNNTGWEHSWHREMMGGIYPTGPRWNGDDYQARISYFREDVGWSNSYEYWNMRFAPWLSTAQYPDIHFSRRGEHLYHFIKWILDRYTMERLSFMLPTITTYETDKPMPGYNSHLVDYMGRSFLARSDGIIPEVANTDASWECDVVESRLQKALDARFLFVDGNGTIDTSTRTGLDVFARMVFATRESYNRKYFKALFFQLINSAKEVVNAPNDRDYTTSPLGLTMTQLRDPAFYMILANLDSWFNSYLEEQMHSYEEETLRFPGVSMEKFEVSKLMTFNDRRKYELTNGLPFKHEEDRYKKRSFANQYYLDHEPFDYEFTVKSDKDQDAMIRVMIAPKKDADGRLLTINQQRRIFMPLNKYIVHLKSGDNVFKKHSFQPEFYDKHENFYDMYAKVNKSIETGETFEYSELTHCGIPYNLQLPKGWASGRDYTMFVMVTPYSEDNIDKEGFYQCRHNIYMDQYPIGFPFDRSIDYPKHFFQKNMYFMDVKIYHQFSKPQH